MTVNNPRHFVFIDHENRFMNGFRWKKLPRLQIFQDPEVAVSAVVVLHDEEGSSLPPCPVALGVRRNKVIFLQMAKRDGSQNEVDHDGFFPSQS